MSRAIVSRYQPALVALHWLVAVMIVGLLCLGFLVLAHTPNTNPAKLRILVWHMAGGISVLLLMIVRLIIRLRSALPVAATIGTPFIDRLASLTHSGLYAIVFAMIGSGWFTGWLISGAYQHPGGMLPDDFSVFPSFRIHAALAAILAVLIAAHVAAALYHQLVLKDGLFRRMWFGARTVGAGHSG